MKFEEFNPNICIASKIQKSNRILNNIFRKHLKVLDLSNSQVSILFVLSKKKCTTQKELADFLFLEKSTINRNIERLIKQNFIERTELNQVAITSTGIDKVLNIVPHWQEAMHEAEEKLGAEGLSSLNTLLKTLIN